MTTGLTPSLVRVPTPYALANPTTGIVLPVAEGRNVIGRSAVPCSDVGFINLDSPRSAISRLHAVIDVAPNHDAWISDCRSTNGTVLAIRGGTGTILEPERFYQLTPGAKVTVGDVELEFVSHSGFKEAPAPAPATSQQPALIRARSKSRQGSQSSVALRPVSVPAQADNSTTTAAVHSPPSDARGISAAAAQNVVEAACNIPARCPTASGAIASVVDLKAGSLVAAIQQLQDGTASRNSNGQNPSSRPYLDDSPTEKFVTREKPTSSKKAREEAQTPSSPLRPSSSHPKTKAPRVEKTVPPPAAKAPPKLLDRRKLCVCLSGMDSAEKQSIAKSVVTMGGRIVEEISDATLLVVKYPPPRTPKFIIAIGMGVPIVTPAYFAEGAPEAFAQYVPDLTHGKRHYASKDLVKVIAANAARGTLPLDGQVFNVQQMPAKTRPTVSDIIRACGGTVSTKKKEGAGVTTLTEDAESVYHAILSGGSS